MKEQQQAVERRREFWSLPPDALVDRDTTGAVLFVGREVMEKFATRGDGPPFTRIGRRALYRKADVLEWCARTGRKVSSTAENQAIPPDGQAQQTAARAARSAGQPTAACPFPQPAR